MLELGPRRIERRGERGTTLVGPLDADRPAAVDGGGSVTAHGAGWSLDWWIGADDRWYFPAREPSVRQRRPSAGPVIETAVRIPSGDAVCTVYAVPSTVHGSEPGQQATVVEIRNDSPVPVALALAVRPYPVGDADGADADTKIAVSWINDRALLVDNTVLRLPRPPSESALAADHDLVADVERGRALTEVDAGWRVEGAAANAVLLYPLPHRTALRFVLRSAAQAELGASNPPTDTAPKVGPDPAALAPSDSVGRGWDGVVDAGGRFEFPDEGLTAAAAAARARLLLTPGARTTQLRSELERSPDSAFARIRSVFGSPPPASTDDSGPGAGDVMMALARSGRWDETADALRLLARSFPVAVDPNSGPALMAGSGVAAATLMACRAHSGVSADLIEECIEPGLQLVRLLEAQPDRVGRSGLDLARCGLALLVEAVGQSEAAAELRSDVEDRRPDHDPALAIAGADIAAVARLMEAGGGVGRWARVDGDRQIEDDLAAAASFWLAARSLVLVERPGSTGSGPVVDLMPGHPVSWRGGTMNVHHAPTIGGLVSFAVRWHGARPALLWEVAGPGPVTLTCSGLDPTWSSTQAKGETLLAGSAEGLADAPAPGDSFQ